MKTGPSPPCVNGFRLKKPGRSTPTPLNWGSGPWWPRITAPTGEISSFFVHPDAKRKGVGRALWEVALREARTAGLAKLHLDADPEAVPFYEAMGFKAIGHSPSGSIPGRMLPKMERAL